MRHRLVIVVSALAVLAGAWPASAQTYSVQKPRRQFITVSYDWLYTQPLHFGEHPLEDLVGQDVAAAQFEDFDYRTRDGAILIDVLEFKRRGHGAGVTRVSVRPERGRRRWGCGAASRICRSSASPFPAPARRRRTPSPARGPYDVSAAIFVADRSPGWGLGSHAFVGGGIGRIKSDCARRRSHLRRRRRRAQLRPDRRGAVDQVRLEPPDRSRRSPLHHRADHAARHGHLLAMQIDAWLKAACDDAERRGLPELKPLLETLARSTAALRDADRSVRSAASALADDDPATLAAPTTRRTRTARKGKNERAAGPSLHRGNRSAPPGRDPVAGSS